MNTRSENLPNAGSRERHPTAATLYNAVRRQGDLNALGQLRKLAESGDAAALNYLMFHRYPQLEGKEETSEWFRRVAERYRQGAESGEAAALYCLGELYCYGYGVPEDEAQAEMWYRRAAERCLQTAESGDANVQYCMGEMWYRGRGVPEDVEQAIRWFLRAAERGHAEAMYRLGGIFSHNYPFITQIPKDSAQALIWWQRAAALGHRDAVLSLGHRAFHWDANALVLFRQLAERDNADAQCELGWMYRTGRGVQRDFEEAAFWYCKAAEQGEKLAVRGLSCLAGRCKAAFACLRQAAERGDADAQFRLGKIYYYGAPDVPEDMEQAEFWYRRAAEQGHKLALDTLSRSG